MDVQTGPNLIRARTLGDDARHLWLLAAGTVALVVPTMLHVGKESWSTEQGAHGPLVLATGIWLISRQWAAIRAAARPGSPLLTAILLAVLLPLYVFSRIAGIIEIEGPVMYAALVVAAYMLVGPTALSRVWFPLVYLLFTFPPPDTLFAAITQPLKIGISTSAVEILHTFGYPIAGSGVTIQIGQYEMLVAAACAGLNSLISLSALGLFYTYIRHSSNLPYMALLFTCIFPIAVAANLIRVLILLLITYHYGEAAGQGFFHEFAGMVMFLIALVGIFVVDELARPIERRLARRQRA